MKYRHHMVFVTNITGSMTMCASFDSDDLVPKQSAVMEKALEHMKEFNELEMSSNDSYDLGLMNLSTVINDEKPGE